MSEGFLSRWSRLKRDRKVPGNIEVGNTTIPPVDPGPRAEVAETPAPGARSVEEQAAPSQPQGDQDIPADTHLPHDPQEDLPPIASLTPQSDFTPFLKRGVAPHTRNAALKKLFADPHYNVMDGLDVYIEDYNITVPIPEQTLARLVRDHASGFVEAAGEWAAGTDPAEPGQRHPGASSTAQAVAQGDDASPQPVPHTPGASVSPEFARGTGGDETAAGDRHPGDPHPGALQSDAVPLAAADSGDADSIGAEARLPAKRGEPASHAPPHDGGPEPA